LLNNKQPPPHVSQYSTTSTFINPKKPKKASPLFFILPLSFEGEGDKGGEVEQSLIEANISKGYTVLRTTFCGEIYASV